MYFYLQVMSDHNLLIRQAFTGWPGCAHDARVLRNSSLYELAESGRYIRPDMFLLADSAYPLKSWLITPFKDNGHLNARQRQFNRVLSSIRQVVERPMRYHRYPMVYVHNMIVYV